MANLAGMRVLVTRPKPLGDGLCAVIESAGGQAVYFPVIEILPPTVEDKNLFHLESFDWLVFISPQAVLQCLASVQNPLSFPRRREPIWIGSRLRGNDKVIDKDQAKIAAIGRGTAQTLLDNGISVDVFPEENWHSEGLLSLPEFQAVENKKVAIIAGENGRTFLMEELTKRGAIVTKIAVYRRALPKSKDLPGKVDVITCTSNESIAHLIKLLPDPNLFITPLVVISEGAVEYARQAGFQTIFLAKNASHHAILEALLKAKGEIMDTQTEEQNQTPASSDKPRRWPWKTIGILFSTFSAVVLICVFYLAYYSLFFFNKNLTSHVAVLQQNVQQLQKSSVNTNEQAQQWQAEVTKQAQAISALQQTQSSNKNIWNVLEAQYLIKRANDDLQFESNIPTAIAFLQSADQELRDATDPKLSAVRQAIANDLATLQAIPQVDKVGIYSQLTALSDQVSKLPLTAMAANQQAKQEVDANLSWWRRGLQQTWQELRKIVVVRYNPSGTLPLMTPEQQDFLYENMQAILEKSMWALLHKQPEIYKLSLQQALTWTKKYFVQDAQVTQAMINSLNALQQIDINPSAPKTLTAVTVFQEYFSAH